MGLGGDSIGNAAMNRFYYEFVELESTGDAEFTYVLYDNRRGDQELARCDRHDDAQKIVDALNAYKPPALGVFG